MLRRPRYVFFTLFKLGKLVSKNGYDVLDMALPPRDQRHPYLRFEGLQYIDADIIDFEERLGRIYGTEFGEAILDLDTGRALQFQLGGVRRRMSWREFILDMGLHTAEEIESVGFDFLGIALSYTSIRDPILRLCHRLIACSIAGRSQALEKVTVTDLFYLRGMDVGSVNIPYILARYLRLFASWKKRGAMISGGQFVDRLAEHFRLLTEERLQGLTMIVRKLPVIDMTELPDVAAGAPNIAKGALSVDEGGQVVPKPAQAPQPPPAAGPARTMAQILARVEEEVHEIRGALGEQREVMDAMARDLSRFTVWAAGGISQLLDSTGAAYVRYYETYLPYERRRDLAAKKSTMLVKYLQYGNLEVLES
ncbi:hypothetical protein Tco_0493230 [Tanacetum coccineum]